MRRAGLWIGALWIWWAVCSALLLAFWGMALTNRSLFILKYREAAMVPRLQELSQSFAPLHGLPGTLVSSLRRDAVRDTLTQKILDEARAQGRPFCHIYWIRADGSAVLASDPPAPGWIVDLVRPQVRIQPASPVIIRPLPPGMEAGRLDAVPTPADAPASYLLTCVGDSRDRILVCSMDLDYVFGPWLRQQIDRFGLDSDVTARRVDQETTWREPRRTAAPRPVDDSSLPAAWRSIRDARAWNWSVSSFFGDDPFPFDRVDVTLSNARALQESLNFHLLSLAGGTLLMLSFAAAIRMGSLGVRRELEFAEARTHFNAMVSHELRTPIAAIRMYAEILENRLVEDPEKIASYHQIIGTEASRLGTLVENLLEVGRIERGARKFNLAPVDVNALVHEAVPTTCESQALELQLAPSLPLVRADREAMACVLSNLIQNAFKYGGASPRPTIATRLAPRGVAIDVMDRGPGIPAAKRQRIFEPYVRIEKEETRASKGAGLGLALVKGFVEGQGGTIAVGDRPGGGAVFTVILPLQPTAEEKK